MSDSKSGGHANQEDGAPKSDGGHWKLLKKRFKKRFKKSDSATTPQVQPDSENQTTEPEAEEIPAAELSLRLWTGAYDGLKQKGEHSDLVEDYEIILTKFIKGDSALKKENIFKDVDGTRRLQLMKQIVDKSQEKAKAHPRTEAVGETAGQIIEFASETVGGLLEAYPPAALAWSGICTLTPLFLKHIQAKKKMLDGLTYVIDQIDFSMKLAPLLLRENWKDDTDFKNLRDTMSKSIQNLYQSILLFEMNAVKACNSHWGTFFKDLVSYNDWDGQRKAIESTKAQVTEQMSQYNKEAEKEYLRTTVDVLSKSLDNQGRSLLEQQKSISIQEKAMSREMSKDHEKMVGEFNVTQHVKPSVEELSPLRVSDTCEWFFGNDKYYQHWLNSKENKVLVVSAPPGCGKSVLAATLCLQELPRQQPGTQVCYYFFKNQTEQQKITHALRILLNQLLANSIDLVAHVESEIRKEGKALMDDFYKLKKIFELAIKAGKTTSVICVLDALDECDPADLKTLLDWITSTISLQAKDDSTGCTTLKFLLTTRGLPKILNHFEFSGSIMQISTDGKENETAIQNEIQMVMEARFHQFVKRNKLDTETADVLWKGLQQSGKEERTYLWVELIFQELETTRKTKKAFESLMKAPPQDIYDLYDRLLASVQAKDIERVRVLLSLIFAAPKPLTLDEANFAVTLHLMESLPPKNLKEIGEELESEKHFLEWLTNTCGYFVTVYGKELYFIHQTAKDYLSDMVPLPVTPNDPSKEIEPSFIRGKLNERIAHAVSAECYITYLAMDPAYDCWLEWCTDKAYKLQALEVEDTKRWFENAPIRASFLMLAMTSWIDHFRGAREIRNENARVVAVDVDDKFSPTYCALWKHLPDGELKPVLGQSIKLWLRKERKDVNRQEEFSTEPLFLSVLLGQSKLFEHYLRPNGENQENFKAKLREQYYRLLQLAVEERDFELQQLMLDRLTEVSPISSRNSSLSAALRTSIHWVRGNPQVDMRTARLLIEHGALIDEPGREDMSPLAATLHFLAGADSTCAGGRVKKIEDLLKLGANWQDALEVVRKPKGMETKFIIKFRFNFMRKWLEEDGFFRRNPWYREAVRNAESRIGKD
ncbi:hypothetical protein BT63DRAFT_425404 [Microthyrium microscopicum]|uniref:NWD NACHT-NTPase N-terminal domain-containing protein n=1 Tax=Microthyrium microscopicum TaxID=703497 RepID=A0A6A6UCY3_9PEZI|nr:hypothetical protein BT63DRAFT_425404 [Microthyrium microscopicum]